MKEEDTQGMKFMYSTQIINGFNKVNIAFEDQYERYLRRVIMKFARKIIIQQSVLSLRSTSDRTLGRFIIEG